MHLLINLGTLCSREILFSKTLTTLRGKSKGNIQFWNKWFMRHVYMRPTLAGPLSIGRHPPPPILLQGMLTPNLYDWGPRHSASRMTIRNVLDNDTSNAIFEMDAPTLFQLGQLIFLNFMPYFLVWKWWKCHSQKQTNNTLKYILNCR